ncbi:MAG TPA: ATP-binding protein [Pyrinomonadaceae bacterium]|jgi:signal transduction histidine kinase|nr:ATP-binding protein [Pyrinomonadaceae bacterium]
MKEKKPAAGGRKGTAEGRVIYSRVQADEREREDERRAGKGQGGGAQERVSLAPMLAPLLIGFALLVGLVIGLGYMSSRRLQSVSNDALERERQMAGKLRNLLALQVGLTRVNNEARARARVEGTSGLQPPLNLPLRNARRELADEMKTFDHLPVASSEPGQAFKRDVAEFLATTENLDRYSLEGFAAYTKVENALDKFLFDTKREQEEIPAMIEESKRAARKDILFLTLLSVLTGSIVAFGTTWEVQRRFREIRRTLEDVRRERQFSRQILKGMVSAIAAIDRDNHLRSANDAFFKVFPDAKIGASIHASIASPEGLKMLSAAIATRVRRATYRGRWKIAQGADGAARSTFDVYSSPLQLGGEPGQLITLVDVTEAAQAEEELRRQESLAAVGQAAAQVAHEIKNPLGSIRLGVAMLRDMTDNREAISTIDLVERGIDHLNKLTLDVTQFSRQRQLSISAVDLHELLNASLDLVADKIREKRTPVERQFSASPLSVECDADQMRQVFVNLFANAADASPPESPLIVSTETVTGEKADSSKANGEGGRQITFARINIADKGSGMDDATRARIFEPFFTTKKRGTGLGLAIAKQIVEQHGGHITVNSAPNIGTRFTIDLPLKQS